MSRYTFVLAALVSLAGFSSGGCRSCSSCHDYDPPVANCGCCESPCNCSQGSGSPCNCGGDHGANGDYEESSPAPANNPSGAYAKSPSGQQPRTYRPANATAAAQQQVD